MWRGSWLPRIRSSAYRSRWMSFRSEKTPASSCFPTGCWSGSPDWAKAAPEGCRADWVSAVQGHSEVRRQRALADGKNGTGALDKAGSAYEWHEFPAPAQRSDLVSPIEGENGEVFVSAMRPGRQRVVLRFFKGTWKDIYFADGAGLKAWRGPEGKIWILKKPEDYPARGWYPGTGDSGVDRAIAGLTTAVIAQPDHSFWLGTTKGVARYSPPLWHTPDEIAWADGAVSAITADTQGRVWFLNGQFLIVNDRGKWNRFRLPSGATEPSSPTILLCSIAAIWRSAGIHWQI